MIVWILALPISFVAVFGVSYGVLLLDERASKKGYVKQEFEQPEPAHPLLNRPPNPALDIVVRKWR